MSAMNSPPLNNRSFLYSIPLSHMQLQNYTLYSTWTNKIQKKIGNYIGFDPDILKMRGCTNSASSFLNG